MKQPTKSFYRYLIESKKYYEFKVRVAADVDDDACQQIEQALVQYDVANCKKGKRSPIQKSHKDFPNHKNVSVTAFDIATAYPVTTAQIRISISAALNLSQDCVIVRTDSEYTEEFEINKCTKSNKALLLQDYEPSDNQKVVGTKHAFSLLKELNKVKHNGYQYKGVNDELLADELPGYDDSIKPKADKFNTNSAIGSTKKSKFKMDR